MKKWKCTVCGYIHEGDTPPDVCPLCNAPAEMFEEVVEEKVVAVEESKSAPQKNTSPEQVGGIAKLVMKLHLHPILVHTPNGALPIALIFMILSVILGQPMLEVAAYLINIVVLLSMPVVLLTGFVEWQNRYSGGWSSLFKIKIAASSLVFSLLTLLVGWRFIDPGVLGPESAMRFPYLLIGVIMVGAAGFAGHLGGKLVFGSRES